MRNGYRVWQLVMMAALAFIALVIMFSVCLKPSYGQEPIVVTIDDFGQGMTPVTGPYTNNPEAITLSENMMSTQPGGRQLRYGYTPMMKAKSSASALRSMAFYAPKNDSASIIHTAAGIWWDTKAGGYSYSEPGGQVTWITDTLAAGTRIRPYKDGDSIVVNGPSVKGYRTRFVRDLQQGDTITLETGATDTMRMVKTVIADDSLEFSATSGISTTKYTIAQYTVGRTYKLAQTPFLLQSGEYVYTGTVADPPQIIYNVSTTSNDTRYIRSMGIVDSFYIDSIYSNYNDTLVRRSWDTLGNGKKMIKEIQIVSRRQVWFPNQWVEDVSGNPQAYYVRLGHSGGGSKYKTKFYAIEGNSDTSIYLRTWYVDSLIAGTTKWRDSIFQGAGGNAGDIPTIKDTLTAADVEGTWGYIYSACGNVKTVLADASTNIATLLARGSVWILTGADALTISPDSFYNSLHYLHLTANDVAFPQFTNTQRLKTYTKKANWAARDQVPPPDPTLPKGDTIIAVRDSCETRWSENFGSQRFCTRYWTIQSSRAVTVTAEFSSTASGWYPVRYAVLDTVGTDTLVIVTGPSPALNDTTNVTTANWELVRVGLPYWSGMVEWGNVPQLVAWGDSSSGSLLSFSGFNDPWNWSVTRDMVVGRNFVDPIVGVLGYDEGITIGKTSSTFTWDGETVRELSASVGLAGPNAAVVIGKEYYRLATDGLYRTDRRDFSGYADTKISTPLDPVFNAWNAIASGIDVVPFRINPKYRHKCVLVPNQRDNHLYLLFPQGSDTVNSRILTYDWLRNQWDGYFTFGGSDAMWAVIRDTARILFGSNDSAYIWGMDYKWVDGIATGIDARLQSNMFWTSDAQGWPVESQFTGMRFFSRSIQDAVDSAYILLIAQPDDGSSASSAGLIDTMRITYDVITPRTKEQAMKSSRMLLSKYWRWEIKWFAPDAASTPSIFQPIQLQLEFVPVRRDDS